MVALISFFARTCEFSCLASPQCMYIAIVCILHNILASVCILHTANRAPGGENSKTGLEKLANHYVCGIFNGAFERCLGLTSIE